jgi:hypothetical protein
MQHFSDAAFSVIVTRFRLKNERGLAVEHSTRVLARRWLPSRSYGEEAYQYRKVGVYCDADAVGEGLLTLAYASEGKELYKDEDSLKAAACYSE